MNIKRTLLLLAAATLVAIGLVTCKPSVPPEKKLEEAKVRLFQNSPIMNDMYKYVQSGGYRVTIKVGNLTGPTEGSTWISENEAVITIDVSRVEQSRDRLEPVLAHEIIHINDARFKFGFERFISLVDSEKNIPWHQRTVEKSAIEQEDYIRRALLATGNYKGMAPTRELQNLRH
jgi:hypothetical protein